VRGLDCYARRQAISASPRSKYLEATTRSCSFHSYSPGNLTRQVFLSDFSDAVGGDKCEIHGVVSPGSSLYKIANDNHLYSLKKSTSSPTYASKQSETMIARRREW
jgi:hypothetical protein